MNISEHKLKEIIIKIKGTLNLTFFFLKGQAITEVQKVNLDFKEF